MTVRRHVGPRRLQGSLGLLVLLLGVTAVLALPGTSATFTGSAQTSAHLAAATGFPTGTLSVAGVETRTVTAPARVGSTARWSSLAAGQLHTCV